MNSRFFAPPRNKISAACFQTIKHVSVRLLKSRSEPFKTLNISLYLPNKYGKSRLFNATLNYFDDTNGYYKKPFLNVEVMLCFKNCWQCFEILGKIWRRASNRQTFN